MNSELNPLDLIQIFNTLFSHEENTRLIAGDDEPIYLPADAQTPYHQVIFAHGFYESALHEISHWCIAGHQRRQLVDFGYWYQPDGRTVEQQRAFEQVEVKPQALEWILSVACGRRFRVSTDNLDGDREAVEQGLRAFRLAVGQQVSEYLSAGLPPRAEQLKQALLNFYQRHDEFAHYRFDATQI